MKEIILEAIEEAKKAFSKNEVPVGAVLVKNDKIIARAHNLVETNQDASAHAEMLCLKNAAHLLGDWRLSGTTLVTTLEPCIMCAGSIILHRVEKVIYLAKDLRHGAHGSIVNVFEKKHPIHNILISYVEGYPEASLLLKEFFQLRRKNGKPAKS